MLYLLSRLNQTYQKLLAENEGLQVEHKSIKTQLNSCKLEQTQLESELSKLKEQNQQLEISSIKLANQCEVRNSPFKHSRMFLKDVITSLHTCRSCHHPAWFMLVSTGSNWTKSCHLTLLHFKQNY